MKKIAVSMVGLLALVGAACSANATAQPTAAKKPATPKPALSSSVGVTAGDMFLRSTATTVATGKVTFTVSNSGPSSHEFVIVTGDPTGTTGDEAGRVSEDGHIGGDEGPEIGASSLPREGPDRRSATGDVHGDVQPDRALLGRHALHLTVT